MDALKIDALIEARRLLLEDSAREPGLCSILYGILDKVAWGFIDGDSEAVREILEPVRRGGGMYLYRDVEGLCCDKKTRESHAGNYWWSGDWMWERSCRIQALNYLLSLEGVEAIVPEDAWSWPEESAEG